MSSGRRSRSTARFFAPDPMLQVERPVTPELRLWHAVVERALRDAAHDPSRPATSTSASPVDRRRVRAWADTQDCRDVCDYADVDYDAVRAYVKAYTSDLRREQVRVYVALPTR